MLFLYYYYYYLELIIEEKLQREDRLNRLVKYIRSCLFSQGHITSAHIISNSVRNMLKNVMVRKTKLGYLYL